MYLSSLRWLAKADVFRWAKLGPVVEFPILISVIRWGHKL